MHRFFILLALILSSYSYAQERKFVDVCKIQIAELCQEETKTKDPKAIFKCLAKNESKLSDECKQEIQRTAKLINQTTPPGSGPLGMLGGMTSLGPMIPMLTYEGRVVPSGDNGKKAPAIAENNLRLNIPVYRNESHTVSTSVTNNILHLEKRVTLDSGLKLPHDFYRTELGLQYTRRLPEQRTYGLQGTFGYTGDKFNPDTQTYSVNANYSYPGKSGGHWVLMLIFSNNNPLGDGVPIPGFFYVHRTQTFTGVFGLPVMSMQWTPVNPWAFSFSMLGPIIRAEASYGTIDETQFFVGLGWTQQRYMLSERVKEDDRLTFEEKRAEIGLRRPLGPKIFAELKAGYAFDRAVYIGEGLLNRDGGEDNLGNAWSAGWTFRFLF